MLNFNKTHVKDRIVEKCDYFSSIQVWPMQDILDPEGWLSNFSANEKKYALQLLNFFTYFSEPLVDALFTAAIHNLSVYYRMRYGLIRNEWFSVRDTYFTLVTGENPSPADSGYLFMRKVRDRCKFEEDSFIQQENIVKHNMSDCNIVFVDDFVGSGNQIITSLKRRQQNGKSLFEYMNENRIHPIYCNMVCTKYGLNEIHKFNKYFTVLTSHLIGDEYSVFHNKTLCWNGDDRKKGISMIKASSLRSEITSDLRIESSWKGFHKLGLALSFYHCTPDATLPIFTWNKHGWKPLIRT